MPTFGENLRQIAESKGVTPSELARRMGITRQSINSLFKETNPRMETLKRAADALRVKESLLMGADKDTSLHQSQSQSQGVLLGAYIKEQLVSLPYLSIPVVASFIENEDCNPENLGERYEFVPEKGDRYDKSMIIEVSGSSMAPRIVSGDKLLARQIDPGDWVFLNPGIYAMIYHKTFTIKRIKRNTLREGYIELVADNEMYGMEKVPMDAIRCIWKIERIVAGRLD